MTADYKRDVDVANLWETIRKEVTAAAKDVPLLAGLYQRNVLDRANFSDALAHILVERCLADQRESAGCVARWRSFVQDLYQKDPQLVASAEQDLLCQLQGNASIKDHFTPLLYFGGFHALQCYRIAHYCWKEQQRPIANYIQGQMTTQFGVDIHPAATIGSGIFIDHAVAIVVGETAVIEDDVTIFQSVTLGGTGKGHGDRHPKIRRGAFLGSGAVVLGNIEVGPGARVAAGAVVVKNVPANATMVGQAARQLQTIKKEKESDNQFLADLLLDIPSKVYQDDFSPAQGNALQACIAALLGESLHDVPNFIALPVGYEEGIRDYIEDKSNATYTSLKRKIGDDAASFVEDIGKLCILRGKSPRGDFGHVVIARILEPGRFTMVHDPHPDATFLDDSEGYGWFMVFVRR